MIIDVDAVIYGLLINASSVTALVSTRIYNSIAPVGAATPYVVFYLASGNTDTTTSLHDINYVYRVESVSDTRQSAQNVHEAVYNALHLKQAAIVGHTNYWLAASTTQMLVDNNAGQIVWRKIQDYRIRISINS